MGKVCIVSLMLFASLFLAHQGASAAQSPENESEPQFRVLSPWAEADPIPPRGISPRLDNLEGKKIGLFANFKRASLPIAEEVAKNLKKSYPGCETSIYESHGANVIESETKNRERFVAWVKGVDAVILAVGD
jgi:hypothetical protein